MLWEIDGFEVEVIVQKREGVAVLQWDVAAKRVAVAASLAKDEAIFCIRKLTAEKESLPKKFSVDSLLLFDRNWPVKIQSAKLAPYIQAGIVYAFGSGDSLSTRQTADLQEILLQQHITNCVGLWEERLNILIPGIAFRKFKTKPYSICLKRKWITFDKNLHRLKLEVIDYGVFTAISTYVKLEEKARVNYISRYFPSYKNYDKVLAYEYRCGDSD